MLKISFKERVKNISIAESKNYKTNFVDYEYLVCSDAFKLKAYYILDAKEDNYQHLIGVHSLISAQEFFDKSYNGTLQETDFDFIKNRKSEQSVKGSVREKIKVLSNAMNIFNNKNIKVQEDFSKNIVNCSLATSDNTCTLGFIDTLKSRPMTLLKGNELAVDQTKDINLLLRKKAEEEKFNEIIIGNSKILMKYYEKIKEHIGESLISFRVENIIDKEIAIEEIEPKETEVVEAGETTKLDKNGFIRT